MIVYYLFDFKDGYLFVNFGWIVWFGFIIGYLKVDVYECVNCFKLFCLFLK